MKNTIAIVVGLSLLPSQASAEFPGLAAARSGISLNDGGEGLTVSRYPLYTLPGYRNGDDPAGPGISYRPAGQQDWRQTGGQISLVRWDSHASRADYWHLEAGLYQPGEHRLSSLDGSSRSQVADWARAEDFAGRSWVETAPALDRGIYFSFQGSALEPGLGERFTVVGAGGSQFFSDGNHRSLVRLKGVYQPLPDSGLTLQARQNFYHSSTRAADLGYFNPENYRSTLFGIGYRQRLQGWVGAMTLETGPQRMDDEDSQRARLLEVSMESDPSLGASLKLRGGLSRAAGFIGPNYDYRYLQAEWLLPF